MRMYMWGGGNYQTAITHASLYKSQYTSNYFIVNGNGIFKNLIVPKLHMLLCITVNEDKLFLPTHKAAKIFTQAGVYVGLEVLPGPN